MHFLAPENRDFFRKGFTLFDLGFSLFGLREFSMCIGDLA